MSSGEFDSKAEELRDFLLELVARRRDVISKLDGTELQEKYKTLLELRLSVIRDNYPQRKSDGLILYKAGREKRTFEAELKRLWSIALKLHQDNILPQLIDFSMRSMPDADSPHRTKKFRQAINYFFEKKVLPLINGHEDLGDEIYLLTCEIMNNTDEAVVVEEIAKNATTPAQLPEAILGIFGLLISAEKSKKAGLTEEAYSYLIDANHMIGLYEGASFPMRHIHQVSKKLNAINNGRSSRKSTNTALNETKSLAEKLFYSIMQDDNANPEGKAGTWPSAQFAMEKVWDALIDISRKSGKKKPDISESTLLKLCQKLHKKDKDMRRKNRFGINVMVKHTEPDGSVVNIPVDYS